MPESFAEKQPIGYYCINSDIVAKCNFRFIQRSGHRRRIRAEVIYQCLCGSELERKTTLEVTGFNRQALVRRLDELFHEISTRKIEMQKLKSQPESSGRNSLSEKMSILRDEIKSMEAERKQIALYLKKKGDGEISVTKRIYPNSCIILGYVCRNRPSGDGSDLLSERRRDQNALNIYKRKYSTASF